ncbi:thiol reductant ABC exporter subunit CydC [Oricola nitratireducens]|uniref:thiol reductant ABC exporter subunit CydC n=1 Tax=Oricola nitratireducens TaxID=2775868 RepID=UPI00186628DA|nr:thiol reductant ABC exporter subunit CydC [Oricola nitratireducens]
MIALLQIARRIWSLEWWSLLRGMALSATVLLAGIGLLGLSGWFITAAGVAGLAGAGILFDVFRPSAGVRFLALGRTAARYGERMLTHDATLRGLARLRVQLLAALARLPAPRQSALRASEQLNRLTLDVDALDGIALRLFIPVVAGTLAIAIAFAALWYLVDPAIVVWLSASFLPGASIALALVLARARRPSRSAQLALNAFRMRLVDLLHARSELAVFGRLAAQREHVHTAEERMRAAMRRNDRIERTGGFVLSLAETIAAAGALVTAVWLTRSGRSDPALAALGFFATLALAETIVPLRRGLSEYGKMADAARRVARMLQTPELPSRASVENPPGQIDTGTVLSLRGIGFRHQGAASPVISGFDLVLRQGEICALTGSSGSGKSTILHIAAGVLIPESGSAELNGLPIGRWDEKELRETVTLLPQRSALLSGTIRDALRLANPDITDADAWEALAAAGLDMVISQRGGLESRLGESGSGLSGGESRRLALARVLLRRPRLLLLDEPTEGLDRATAETVLAGVRRFLPDSAILIASHRQVEQAFANRTVRLRR